MQRTPQTDPIEDENNNLIYYWTEEIIQTKDKLKWYVFRTSPMTWNDGETDECYISEPVEIFVNTEDESIIEEDTLYFRNKIK